MPTTPYLRSGILPVFKSLVEQRGLSFEDLALRSGLALTEPADPRRRVPLEAVMTLFELTTAQLGPSLPFDVANALVAKPGSSGLIGEIVLTARSVRDALRDISTFMPVFLDPIDIIFIEEDDLARLEYAFPSSISAHHGPFTQYLTAGLIYRLRDATGAGWTPYSAQFDHPEPDCPDLVRSTFGPRTRFDTPRNVLVLDGPPLDRPMPGYSPTRAAIIRDLAERWLQEPANWVDDVRETITALRPLLKARKADLASVSQAMGISAARLQGRLQRAGTTFEAILNDERKAQADHLLRNTDTSLTDIALDLGFSDSSTFSRAANRWFSMTPSAWRRLNRKSLG